MKLLVLGLLLFVLVGCSKVIDDADHTFDLGPNAFGTAGDDAANGLAKHSTGVYVVGYTNGDLHRTNNGFYDGFIRKYNSQGTMLWGRQFGTAAYDKAVGVASDSQNNAYVTGETSGQLAGQRGGADIFLRKYTASGDIGWTKQFGSIHYDAAGDVAMSGSNLYVVGGVVVPSSNNEINQDVLLAKFTPAGKQVWSRTFGTELPEIVSDVAVDTAGNAYVLGDTYGYLNEHTSGDGRDIFVRKYSSSGKVMWTKILSYNESDLGKAITVTGNNIYIASQYGFYDEGDMIVLTKLNTAGAVVWESGFLLPYQSDVHGISANSSSIFLSGETSGSVQGSNRGQTDGFVVKYSPTGIYLWGAQQGSRRLDATYDVAVIGEGVYAAGRIQSDLDFPVASNQNAFLDRLNANNGTNVWMR